MRSRVTRSPEALYGVRVAWGRYRCDGHLADDRHHIEPGQRYVASALPPNSDIGNLGWWHNRMCMDCAPEDFAAESGQ